MSKEGELFLNGHLNWLFKWWEVMVSEVNEIAPVIEDYDRSVGGFAIMTIMCLPPDRVTEHEDTNQMSASNLGIVFGPTLLRPE